ncbi:MAG TPA: DedA family protein [Tepidisphaeraceae bacterium]
MEMLAFFSIDTVKEWMSGEGLWGGALLSFALLFACGLGLPLPEDIPLLISGAFLVTDVKSWVIVGLLNWAGIIGGDCCLYFLARRYGMNITRVPIIGKHVTVDRIKRVEVLFDKYGVGVVAVGRLFAGIRGAMVVTAGTIKFSFWKFFIADSIAAIVSGGLFMVLGHYLGKTLNDETISKYKHWFLLGAIVLAVIFIAYILWRRRTHKAVSDVVAEKVVEKVAEIEAKH